MKAAEASPAGLTVFCDPTLGPLMRSLDPVSRVRTGASISILSAPATSMLAQIQRGADNDILFTLSNAMDQAVRMRLVEPQTRVDGWSNQLVLAAVDVQETPPLGQTALFKRVASSRVALTDPTVASDLDGRAVLQQNGLVLPVGNGVVGAATTADVVFLLTSGAADVGLIYRTDVRANGRLRVIATLSSDPKLTNYAAAVNAKATSPISRAFLALLANPSTAGVLRQAGLEMPA